MKLKITLFSALLLVSSQALAQQDDDLNAIDDTPHLTIVGRASAQVVPDLATIGVGVKAERPMPAEASAEAARIAAAVIGAAKAQGVEARDIQTGATTLAPVFDDIRDAAGHVTGQRPRGFSAGSTVTVRVRALDKAGAIAQSLIEGGASELRGIDFSLENPAPVEDRLVADAARDAQRKAGLTAAALGVKLGRVLLVERPEAPAGGSRPRVRRMAAQAAPAIPVEPGTRTLSREMEVTWSLEP